MRKSQFTEQQIVAALRQVESGTTVGEVCRKLGVTEQTFYRWKRKFAGMGIAELRRLREVEDENRRLKQIVARVPASRVASPLIDRCCKRHFEKTGEAGSEACRGAFPPGRLQSQ